eukprot:2354777-Prymnesium_polylepis.1
MIRELRINYSRGPYGVAMYVNCDNPHNCYMRCIYSRLTSSRYVGSARSVSRLARVSARSRTGSLCCHGAPLRHREARVRARHARHRPAVPDASSTRPAPHLASPRRAPMPRKLP